MSQMINKAVTTFLDVMFPPRCAGCDRPGALWCDVCRASVAPIRTPACPTCLKLVWGADGCDVCRDNPNGLDGLHAVGIYTPGDTDEVRPPFSKAIRAYKYQDYHALAEPLAAMLADILVVNRPPATLVAPVPSHPRRLAERGYDHAYELARRIAHRLGLPCRPDTLLRTRYTLPQARRGLSHDQRRENVKGAFIAGSMRPGSVVLLIDDVYTSGATMTECALMLRQAGAHGVWGAVLGRSGAGR